ncbi:Alpha/Beta hydrolase protein [Stachybotrys elegans]|uniref:Alpha/Beta hydrolase protein n=1 Tax=Stachybotrys elegans TaxID=80388 RepID=A0A8K0WQF1_9HYPO|nr:Alpha/Beta hydrolase protein [Stachybotrys elegans]
MMLEILGWASMASAALLQHTGVATTQDGVHLTYTQTGPATGQDILLIPGWRQTAAEWRKQVDYFSTRGFHVTTYDMRGHGESEKADVGYRISRFAADLDDLLTELDLTDLVIVGHSMGCSVTWAWWDQYPAAHQRVKKLVFVDEPATLVADPNWTAEQAANVSAIFDTITPYNLAANMETQLPILLRSMFTDSLSESDFEWLLSENRKISDENAGTLFVDHSFRDWRKVLPLIDVPALVITGAASISVAQGVAWEATQMPQGQSYVFSTEEKGSHFMFWENPERFNSIVEDFVSN